MKKNKIKKKMVLNEYIEQQINKEEYYHWSSKLIILTPIGTSNT